MSSRRVANPSYGTCAGINVSTDTLPPGCKHVDENPKGSCKNLEKGAPGAVALAPSQQALEEAKLTAVGLRIPSRGRPAGGARDPSLAARARRRSSESREMAPYAQPPRRM